MSTEKEDKISTSFTEEPFAGCYGKNTLQKAMKHPGVHEAEQLQKTLIPKRHDPISLIEKTANTLLTPISEEDFNKVITLVHSIKHPHVKFQSSELMIKEVAEESIKKAGEVYDILKKYITKNTKI